MSSNKLLNSNLLRCIMFRGFLTVRQMGRFECACGKDLHALWRDLINDKSKFYDCSGLSVNYKFHTMHSRNVSEKIDEWLNRRVSLKLYSVTVSYFNDRSCLLGTDILINQTQIHKLTILKSFSCFPPEQNKTSRFDLLIKNCARTLTDLTINDVPYLNDNSLMFDCKLECLRNIKIIGYWHSMYYPNGYERPDRFVPEYQGLLQLMNKCSTLVSCHIDIQQHGRCSDEWWKSKNLGSRYNLFKSIITRNPNLCHVYLSPEYVVYVDLVRIKEDLRREEEETKNKEGSNHEQRVVIKFVKGNEYDQTF